MEEGDQDKEANEQQSHDQRQNVDSSLAFSAKGSRGDQKGFSIASIATRGPGHLVVSNLLVDQMQRGGGVKIVIKSGFEEKMNMEERVVPLKF